MNIPKEVIGKGALDAYICTELKNANIKIKNHIMTDLEKASLKGVIGALDTSIRGTLAKGSQETASFIRRAGYWLVHTEIPLITANELFQNRIGRRCIIINGQTNHYEPLKHARPSGKEMSKAALTLGREIMTDEVMELYKQGIICGELYISLYHIYSQDGLNLFAETMRKHGLAD